MSLTFKLESFHTYIIIKFLKTKKVFELDLNLGDNHFISMVGYNK